MIKIAVIGAGGMANTHAASFKKIAGCRVVAVCDVIRERAEDFARGHGIPEVYNDVEQMLSSANIDTVTVVTPDGSHAEISLKAVARGRHVLCEKPLAENYADARKMAAAAKRKAIINMVNLSYRNASAIHKAHKLVREGRIGRVIHFEASYLQSWLASKAWGDWRSEPAWLWRLSKKHGSKGALGDIGVHIIDFATYPAGEVKFVNCRLKTFPKAKGNRIGEYKFDANDSAVITIELANGAIGTIHTTRWATGQANSLRLRIFGDKGAIVVDLDKSYDTLQLCSGRDVEHFSWKTVKCGKTPSIYHRFIKSIQTGVNDQPDFARGAAVQKIMDACFESDRLGRTVKV